LHGVALLALLCGLVTAASMFRGNTSVSVLRRLWTRPPVVLAAANTLVVVAMESTLVVLGRRGWMAIVQSVALTCTVVIVISSDAILVLPQPRVRALWSCLLMSALAYLVFQRTMQARQQPLATGTPLDLPRPPPPHLHRPGTGTAPPLHLRSCPRSSSSWCRST
jgi:hypothetical protein